MRMEHKSPHPDIEIPSPIPQKDRISNTINTDISTNYPKTDASFVTNADQPVAHFIQPPSIKTDNLVNKTISSDSNEIIKYETFENMQTSEQLTQNDSYKTQIQPVASPLSMGPNLTPGPPPEIGFMPKANEVNRTSISDRIKKLENSFDETHEAPSGGVKVFPPGNHFESHELHSETVIQKSINEAPVSHAPVTTTYRPVSTSSIHDVKSTKIVSPRPLSEYVAPPWTSPKPYEAPELAKSPILTDVNHESLRKQTIRETAKAIENKVKEYESNEYELKAPRLVRHVAAPTAERFYSPKPANDVSLIDLNLQPGPPPEMCFAPRTGVSSPKTTNSTPTPTPVHKVEGRRFKPIKSMETSGYIADTEESLYSCTKTERFESCSNKQYYETLDNKQITQSQPISYFDSKTEKTFQTSGNVEKVRFQMYFCVYVCLCLL